MLFPDPVLRSTYISMGKKMTYRISKPRGCQCGTCRGELEPEPQLQLFHINRAVYEEAREIFYKENEFNTILSSGLGATAFLKDRPDALSMIRKLSFDIPLHTADFSYNRWTDKHYIALFKMMKEEIDMRQLTLNFHGNTPPLLYMSWECMLTFNRSRSRCDIGAMALSVQWWAR